MNLSFKDIKFILEAIEELFVFSLYLSLAFKVTFPNRI